MGWVVGDWLGQELILAEDGQGIHLQTFAKAVLAAQEAFAPYPALRHRQGKPEQKSSGTR